MPLHQAMLLVEYLLEGLEPSLSLKAIPVY